MQFPYLKFALSIGILFILTPIPGSGSAITLRPRSLEDDDLWGEGSNAVFEEELIVRRPRSNDTASPTTLNVHIIPPSPKNDEEGSAPPHPSNIPPSPTTVSLNFPSPIEYGNIGSTNTLNKVNASEERALAGDFNYGKIAYGNVGDEIRRKQHNNFPSFQNKLDPYNPPRYGYKYERPQHLPPPPPSRGMDPPPYNNRHEIKDNFFRYRPYDRVDHRPPPPPPYRGPMDEGRYFSRSGMMDRNYGGIEGSEDRHLANQGYTRFYDQYRGFNRNPPPPPPPHPGPTRPAPSRLPLYGHDEDSSNRWANYGPNRCRSVC